jgi:hypothetical protein
LAQKHPNSMLKTQSGVSLNRGVQTKSYNRLANLEKATVKNSRAYRNL